MNEPLTDERFREMLNTFKRGTLSRTNTKDLESWLNHVDTPEANTQLFARKVEYELQRRQMSESVKWQKWMTIATAIMAGATLLLAIITYFK